MRQHPSSPLATRDGMMPPARVPIYPGTNCCVCAQVQASCVVDHFVHLATGPDSAVPLRPSRATIAIADDSFVVTLFAFHVPLVVL